MVSHKLEDQILSFQNPPSMYNPPECLSSLRDVYYVDTYELPLHQNQLQSQHLAVGMCHQMKVHDCRQ